MQAQTGWMWERKWHNAMKPPGMSVSLPLCAERGMPDLDTTLSAGEQDHHAGTGLVEGEDGKKPPSYIRCCNLFALCSLSHSSCCTVSELGFSNSERNALKVERFILNLPLPNLCCAGLHALLMGRVLALSV